MARRADRRRIAVARLSGIAASHAAGLRGGTFTRAAALAELATVSTDPDVLADAAAMYVDSHHWYGDQAVELLIEAGADPEALVRYVEQHRERRRLRPF
jgi:hypothetical protein